MMITKYFAWAYFGDVKRVEISRETEKQVVFEDGRREMKITEDRGYFDTLDEAKRFAINYCEDKIRGSKREIEKYESRIDKIRGTE